jgi:dynein heavy chain
VVRQVISMTLSGWQGSDADLCVCLLSCLQFCDVIRGFPLVPSPEIFGLHDNADITCQQAETYELLGTLLGLQPRSSSGSGGAGNSQEAVVGHMAQDILDKVRQVLSYNAR